MSNVTVQPRRDPTDVVWDWRIGLNHSEILVAEQAPRLDQAAQGWEWLISPNHNETLVLEA